MPPRSASAARRRSPKSRSPDDSSRQQSIRSYLTPPSQTSNKSRGSSTRQSSIHRFFARSSQGAAMERSPVRGARPIQPPDQRGPIMQVRKRTRTTRSEGGTLNSGSAISGSRRTSMVAAAIRTENASVSRAAAAAPSAGRSPKRALAELNPSPSVFQIGSQDLDDDADADADADVVGVEGGDAAADADGDVRMASALSPRSTPQKRGTAVPPPASPPKKVKEEKKASGRKEDIEPVQPRPLRSAATRTARPAKSPIVNGDDDDDDDDEDDDLMPVMAIRRPAKPVAASDMSVSALLADMQRINSANQAHEMIQKKSRQLHMAKAHAAEQREKHANKDQDDEEDLGPFQRLFFSLEERPALPRLDAQVSAEMARPVEAHAQDPAALAGAVLSRGRLARWYSQCDDDEQGAMVCQWAFWHMVTTPNRIQASHTFDFFASRLADTSQAALLCVPLGSVAIGDSDDESDDVTLHWLPDHASLVHALVLMGARFSGHDAVARPRHGPAAPAANANVMRMADFCEYNFALWCRLVGLLVLRRPDHLDKAQRGHLLEVLARCIVDPVARLCAHPDLSSAFLAVVNSFDDNSYERALVRALSGTQIAPTFHDRAAFLQGMPLSQRTLPLLQRLCVAYLGVPGKTEGPVNFLQFADMLKQIELLGKPIEDPEALEQVRTVVFYAHTFLHSLPADRWGDDGDAHVQAAKSSLAQLLAKVRSHSRGPDATSRQIVELSTLIARLLE